MMKLRGALATLSVLAGSFLLAASAQGSRTVLCDSVIDSGTYDNVIIQEGALCALKGDVIVEGNVYANGAVDVIIDGIRVEGNVRIKNATGRIHIFNTDIEDNVIVAKNKVREIVVNGNTIGKNVKLRENVAEGNTPDNSNIYVGSCTSGGNIVGGSIQVIDNTAEDVIVNCSEVDGNVTIVDNTATLFGVQVRGEPDEKNTIGGNVRMVNNRAPNKVAVQYNRIDGNLICAGNDPDATLAATDVGGDEACLD